MSKLLQEALADAKAVKRIAIENAKVALEETFQREVTGMFQNKIKEELANEEIYGVGDQGKGLQGSSDIGGTVGGSKKPSVKNSLTFCRICIKFLGIFIFKNFQENFGFRFLV